jgi:hypothetical protein
MRRSILTAGALMFGILGCDQIPFADRIPFLSRGDTETATVDTLAADTTAADTATAAGVRRDTQTPEPTPPVPTRRPQTAAAPLVDEPWTPTDTGTIQPGMSRMDVIAVWGEPVAERQSGNRTYLYYRNGCEVTCGTFDVVFLEDDQVVDAIVRGGGHTYAGVSSSPPDRAAEFTPPGQQDGTMGTVP